jgi:hypothetical protein
LIQETMLRDSFLSGHRSITEFFSKLLDHKYARSRRPRVRRHPRSGMNAVISRFDFC